MPKKPTLKDIATICGCSVTTASRALKNSSTISLSLRKKVKETAKELGYIPNALAESMRTGSTKTIAAIIQDFRNPFFSLIAKYMEEYARLKGYTTLFFTTSESPEQEVSACMKALSKNVDGILLFPTQVNSESTELLISQKIPFTLVGRYFEAIPTNYVVTDDAGGGYLITRHLIEKGAENILFLNGPEYIYSSVKRAEGFRKAVKEAGISSHILTTPMELRETQKIIYEHFREVPEYDAVLTFCDIMGFEAYHALTELKYRIPQDILLGSFDGLQQDIIFPVCLTGAGVDRQKLAEYSVDILLDCIENQGTGEEKPLQQIMIDQFLMKGDTV